MESLPGFGRAIAAIRLIALLLCAVGLADPARANVPELLCANALPTEEGRYPTSEALLRAANFVETAADTTPGAMTDALAALEVPLDAMTPPLASARAEYCAAAGQVMRLATQGSQFQAQTYLLSAFRLAQTSGAERVASRAAFRLGLVSSSGSIVVGARGGARRGRRSRGTLEAGDSDSQTTSIETCALLQTGDIFEASNGFVSVVALQCAAKRALDAGDPQLSSLASLRLARLRLTLTQDSRSNAAELRRAGIEGALQAIPVAARATEPKLRAELTGRLISTALDLGGKNNPMIAAGLAAMQTEAEHDQAAGAYAAALEARLSLADGDRDSAVLLLRQAILLESQRPLPARLPEFYLLLAEADPANRERHALAAYTALENIRPLLPRVDPLTEESTFTLYMRRVFESAVDVQLGGANASNETSRIRDVQIIVEAYRQAELQSAFGSECLPARDALQPQQLRAEEMLLYPILLRDRVELLYVSGRDVANGEVRYRRLPSNRTANRDSVAKLVEQVVLSVGYGEDDSWRDPARALYDLLIKPIEGNLGQGSMLTIIPDGALRALPFATLPAKDGQFLIQKTRLSVAPALAFSQPGDLDRNGALAVVAASLQQELTLPAGFFPKLEGTAAEARSAASSTSAGRYIADFKKADIANALSTSQVDVLHLATHASFNGRSDRAFVVANGETILLSELRNLIAGNRARGDELALLVLSACETAVGDDEASMGLAGAAVQAGATSAIASLWQVSDAGTAELMKQFYARYSGGASRSAALRDAQLALIDGGGENADPGIWAAFTLLGAWR